MLPSVSRTGTALSEMVAASKPLDAEVGFGGRDQRLQRGAGEIRVQVHLAAAADLRPRILLVQRFERS